MSFIEDGAKQLKRKAEDFIYSQEMAEKHKDGSPPDAKDLLRMGLTSTNRFGEDAIDKIKDNSGNLAIAGAAGLGVYGLSKLFKKNKKTNI